MKRDFTPRPAESPALSSPPCPTGTSVEGWRVGVTSAGSVSFRPSRPVSPLPCNLRMPPARPSLHPLCLPSPPSLLPPPPLPLHSSLPLAIAFMGGKPVLCLLCDVSQPSIGSLLSFLWLLGYRGRSLEWLELAPSPTEGRGTALGQPLAPSRWSLPIGSLDESHCERSSLPTSSPHSAVSPTGKKAGFILPVTPPEPW